MLSDFDDRPMNFEDSSRSSLQVEIENEDRVNEVSEGAGKDARDEESEETTAPDDNDKDELVVIKRVLSALRDGPDSEGTVVESVAGQDADLESGADPEADPEEGTTSPKGRFVEDVTAAAKRLTLAEPRQKWRMVFGTAGPRMVADEPPAPVQRLTPAPAPKVPMPIDPNADDPNSVVCRDSGGAPGSADMRNPFLPLDPQDPLGSLDLEMDVVEPDEDEELFNPNKVLIGRIALKCLRVVANSCEDEDRVLNTIHKMSIDDNPYVRSDLMEYVPYMAMFCHSENLQYIIEDHLIPWVMNCLMDESRVVKEAAQVALIVLIERSLVPSRLVEETICPAVLNLPCKLLFEEEIDFVTGIVKLICRMARMLGRETSERLFLDKFCKLAKHYSLYIRRVVVSNFVDFAMVVSQSTVEKFLLPLLVELVEDEDCMIRKACTVVALSLSCMIPMEARKTILTPSFVKLLTDKERLVQHEAYCSLGPLIATFAVPSVTELFYNENGILHLVTRDGCEFRLNGSDVGFDHLVNGAFHPRELIGKWSLKFSKALDGCIVTRDFSFAERRRERFDRDRRRAFPMEHRRNRRYRSNLHSGTGEDSGLNLLSDEGEFFNSFQYWRDPIPEYYLDPAILKQLNKSAILTDQNSLDENWMGRSPVSGLRRYNRLPRAIPPQDVVPDVLLDMFVSMSVPIEPDYDEQMDSEEWVDDWVDDYTHLCAYNIPAVALTLGKKHWPHLRPTYELLSEHSNPKVRRTLAASMHEIAGIVGDSIAANELLPIFHRLMLDEDEVKIAALRIVADFIEALPESERMAILPELSEFQSLENDYDWRVREVWAHQLVELVSMYDTGDVAVYIKPLALDLMQDRVAQVRSSAVLAVISVIRKLKSDAGLLKQLRSELVEYFARCRWERRQVFAHMCTRVFEEVALDMDFAQEFLPLLLDLSGDTVANVRIAVARALSALLKQLNKYLPSDIIPIDRDEIVKVLGRLQNDIDPDVRYCASTNDEAEQ